MREQKNCPYLILLLFSIAVLTAAGSGRESVDFSGSESHVVSYKALDAHSVLAEFRQADRENGTAGFRETYEKLLNKNLPVAKALHGVKRMMETRSGYEIKTAASVLPAEQAQALPESLPVRVTEERTEGKSGGGEKAPGDREAEEERKLPEAETETPGEEAIPRAETVEAAGEEGPGVGTEAPAGGTVPSADIEESAVGNTAADADLQAEENGAETEAAENVGSAPVSTAVGQEYFDDAVFVGDSRIVGLELYSGWENAAFYAERGMEVYSYFTKKYVKGEGGRRTVPEALAGKSFGKVYLMLGINELGSGDHDTFIEQYRKILLSIRESQPEALIYVMAILHVDEKKSGSDPIFNNINIGERNRRLRMLADEMGFPFLDVNEVSCDENGFLPSEYTADGVHMKAGYMSLWTDYLMNHAVMPADLNSKIQS